MATKAQIDANRENAKKSTGPRTAEGKRVVSQNALKHGLFADEAVIRGESHAEYEYHRQGLLAEWCPVGPTESMLAERIVSLSWRLQRAELMQNEAMDCMILRHVVGETDSDLNKAYRKAYGVSPDESPDSREYLALGRIATERWSDNAKLIERLFMHERRIESSLNRTMAYLKKLQIMRRIEYDAATERTAAQADSAPCRGHLARPSRGHSFDCAQDRPAHDLTDHSQTSPGATEQQPRPETSSAQVNNADFVKQSQFAPGLISATPVMERHYDDMSRSDAARNKANQTQFQTALQAHQVVKGEIAAALRASQ